MDPKRLLSLLEQVRDGAVSADVALDTLRRLPFEDLGDATIDHHRSLRAGVPEVVLGEWKSAEQIARLLRTLAAQGNGALATRVSADKAAQVVAAVADARYYETARAVVIPRLETAAGRAPKPTMAPTTAPIAASDADRTAAASDADRTAAESDADRAAADLNAPSAASDTATTPAVAVVCAGTSDLPVAEEAAVTLEFLGHPVTRICDVGVAGLHRLFPHIEGLRRAAVVIVVAGMEGALPSVVAGLVDRPVIGVPTSVGYGVSQGGYAALLGMLSSCSAGILVVNIDNGFGAAVGAARICERLT